MVWGFGFGFATIQAGAQGEHKLARGYEPVITPSVHFLPDPGFRSAVANFLEREREAVRLELEWAQQALPYRSVSSSS
jgi:predicted N-acyltransferase